jgi:hypothetical protein
MTERDYSLALLMCVGAVAWFIAAVLLCVGCVPEVSAPRDGHPIDAGCVPAEFDDPTCTAQLACPVEPYPEGCTLRPSGAVCCERI